MATYDFSRAPATQAELYTRIGARIVALIGLVAEWQDARATRRALNTLSDRELDDIGLVRGDIDDVANGGVFRR